MYDEVRPDELPAEVVEVARLHCDHPDVLTAVAAAFTVWFDIHSLKVETIDASVQRSGRINRTFFSAEPNGVVTLWIMKHEVYEAGIRHTDGSMTFAVSEGDTSSIRMTAESFEQLFASVQTWWNSVKRHRKKERPE